MVPTLVHTLFEPPAAAQVGARVWRSSPNSSQMPPASRRPGRGHTGLRPLPEEHWARPGRTARRSVSTPRFAGPPTWSVSSRQRAAVVRLVGPLGADQTTSGRSLVAPWWRSRWRATAALDRSGDTAHGPLEIRSSDTEGHAQTATTWRGPLPSLAGRLSTAGPTAPFLSTTAMPPSSSSPPGPGLTVCPISDPAPHDFASPPAASFR